MSLWVGSSYASEAFPILEILLWAQAIRLTASSYSIALVATGQQNYGIAGAIVEGITNLAASITGARFMGPVGVAWGTVIGAVCGMLWALFYTMRKASREVPVRASAFSIDAILRPVFCFLPLLLYIGLSKHLHPAPAYLVPALLLTLSLLLWLGGIRSLPFGSMRFGRRRGTQLL
jgi:O-antigen/teichoic acid export membrane protein